MIRRAVTAFAVSVAVILASPVGASDPVRVVPSGQFEGLRYTVVRGGDTLAAISTRTGVSMDAISAANGMTDDRVYDGARLLLEHPNPLTPSSTPAPVAEIAARHEVTAGETLSAIAAVHGTSVSALSAVNGLSDPNLIRVGMMLDIPSGAAAPGGAPTTFRCPVPGARFSYDWGFPRSEGRFHEGADLMAPRGTEIVAPRGGRVTFGESLRGGRFFELTGADGTVYYGAHLDSVIGGDRVVEAGATIGTVGDSGNASGGPSHVHFEIEPANGRPVNPYPFLRDAC